MAIINYLTRIVFDCGSAAEAGKEVRALGSSRPLLVTDRGVRDAGLVETFLANSSLPPGTPVFDGTPGNPDEAAVHECLENYRNHRCDGIVALGGGSPLDLGKAVSLLATHPGPLARYAAISGGAAHITADKPPVVAVPTTAGTGSEVGRAALITLTDGRKLGIISPYLVPNAAICDPDLTLGLPRGLTAATGMDALTHCIETYLSPRDNPVADAIALDGLARARKALPIAVVDGSDRSARRDMMMAALQGGLTFQKGLGAVHSLSHALGALKQPSLHHGTLNAVLLPAVLRFNAVGLEKKYRSLADVMGISNPAELPDEIARLSLSLGLPGSLSAMSVPPDCLPAMAATAMQDHSTATNPREMTEAHFLAILEESW